MEDVEDDPHRRRLAGTVRAEEAEYLTGLHGETDPVERLNVPKALAEPVDHERHRALPYSGRGDRMTTAVSRERRAAKPSRSLS